MKRLIPVSLAAAALLTLFSGSAAAVEFGLLRPLQRGPIGDSPQFADIGPYEGEAAGTLSRTYGSIAVNDDATAKIDASRIHSRLAMGGGWEPTKNFEITGYIDATLFDDYNEDRSRQNPNASLESGLYRHEFAAFALYRTHPLVFGGGVGLLLYGGNTHNFVLDTAHYKEDVGSAAMPVLRLFGGVATKEVDATLGLRLFTQGNAVVTYESGGSKQEFDLARRNPGEIHADGRLKFREAAVAASVSYLLTGQASDQIDEYSTRFTTVGNHKVRDTGGFARDANQLRLAVGGQFEPSRMLTLLGGLTYLAPYYQKEAYASIEDENLGGVRFDLGTDVRIQKFRGFLHAGYQFDSTASFTQGDDTRAAGQVDETLRPPLTSGDSVKVTQGKWDITLGGGVVL